MSFFGYNAAVGLLLFSDVIGELFVYWRDIFSKHIGVIYKYPEFFF